MTQKDKKKLRLPELLAPAGSIDALYAAIEGGADAVYLGGVAFNARINAKNFTHDELKLGIDKAHSYGVKVYIAANTLIYDRELDDYLRAAEDAYLCGADALIVADTGAARLIRSRIPIELHASTQLSGHNADAALRLANAGFSRMVLARETKREDIRAFIEKSPIEAEVFVHGALCVCHSGQCLFSSAVGGRSGNRGECAQPCRLPYRTPQGKSDYPLSLTDLSLARHIPELCEMGVASFKIEGRMKSPEYVRDVVSIWRRLMDEGRGADDRDMRELAAIFSRGGLTDGSYVGKIGSKMLGIRSDADKEQSRKLATFEGITRKLPVTLEAKILRGQPISLKATSGGRVSLAEGIIPEEARTAPIDKERALQSLTKLGGTAFCLENATIELDEGLMLPISALNALRRQAIEGLLPQSNRAESDFIEGNRPEKPKKSRQKQRVALFFDPKNIPDEAKEFFDLIYLPLEHYNGEVAGVMLPPVIFDSERKEIEAMLKRAKELGAEHILVGNIGHIDLAKNSGMTLHGDFRLNTTNNYVAGYYESLGFEDIILSPELTLPRIRDIGGNSLAVVYGRLPLMVTEKCVGKEIADCKTCTEGKALLTDRKGMSFPVLQGFNHRSLILNSVPFYMADRRDELTRSGIKGEYFIFTTEGKPEVARIIEAYKKGLPPKDARAVKRIK